MSAVRRRQVDDRDRDAAEGRTDDAPAWLTLLENDTPRTAWERGMTWASKADSAGRSKPLAMPVTKMTARIPTTPRLPVADSAAKAIAQRVATALVDEHDGAPVAAVRDVAAEQHERQGRDGLDEAEPTERQRVAGDDVRLVRDDRHERARRRARS